MSVLHVVPVDSAVPARAGEAVAWSEHRDDAGFSLLKPVSWRVHAGDGEIAVTDPQGRAAALVRARPMPPGNDLSDWLRRTYAATEPGLHNVHVLRARALSPQVAQAAFDYGSEVFRGRASVIAVRHGSVATLFVAAAAREQFAARLPELTRILDSVRFGSPAGGRQQAGAAAEALQFRRWVDPAESAYSADVPAGWRTEGGLRRSTWNVRLVFSTTSPDGALHVFNGDAGVPRMFTEPNATTRSLGNREGVYAGPDSVMLLRFQRAEDFGAALVRSRFQGAEVTGTRPRPDLVEIARRNPLLQGGLSAATAADVEFRLPDARVGVLTLTTFGAATPGVGAAWWADGIHGFIAPRGRTATAANAMLRMLLSGRENPAWAAGEREHQIRMGQQYQAYLSWSRELQQQTVQQRWLADEARQAGRREILGGTIRLRDPTSGESFEVAGQHRYFFRVGSGGQLTAIGTDTDFKPESDLDLRRLLRIGVEVPER